MDQHPEQVGHFLPEPALQRGLNVVHPRQWKVVLHSAVQREIEPSCHPRKHQVMSVDDLGKGSCGQLNAAFEAGGINHAVAGFDGGRLTLDVGQDARYFWNVVAHLAFQPCYTVVSVLERHALIEFNMLLDMQGATDVLHADVVHVEIVPGGHGADAIEQAFAATGAGDSVDHNIGSRQKLPNSRGNFVGNLLRFLEGHISRHGDGDIGEIIAAAATNADTIDFQHSVNPGNCVDDFGAHSCRSAVEKRVNGPPRQAPTDIYDNAGNHQGRDGIGFCQPWEGIRAPRHHQTQAKNHHRTGPDVGAEMER